MNNRLFKRNEYGTYDSICKKPYYELQERVKPYSNELYGYLIWHHHGDGTSGPAGTFEVSQRAEAQRICREHNMVIDRLLSHVPLY